MIKKSYLEEVLLSFLIIFSITPLWHSFGGNAFNTYLIVSIIFIGLKKNSFHIDKYSLFFISFLVITGSLNLIYWKDFKLISFLLFIITSSLIIPEIRIKSIINFTHISSTILIILIIGGFIGFIYHYLGFPAIHEIKNPDGRSNFLFLSTYSNIVYPKFIRPSGIFDEPGTFSFIICFVVTLRNIFGMSNLRSMILLIGGLITFSFAHFIFTLLFLINFLKSRKTVFLVIFLGILIISNNTISQILNTYLFTRVNNGITSDGRFNLMINAFDVLVEYKHSFLYGLDPSCTYDIDQCKTISGYFSENPLSPLASSGLLISWPYYLFIGFFLFNLGGLRPKTLWNYIPFVLLFLQRPNVLNHGYSTMAYLIFFLALNFKSEELKDFINNNRQEWRKIPR